MANFITRAEGNFKFIAGHGTYCQDVVPLRGYTVAHATFIQPQPLAKGFAAIKKHLAGLGRPMAALCGTELRIANALSFDGFGDFNKTYVALLDKYKLRVPGSNSPLGTMTRTNVAPETKAAKPAEPSIFGFSYTIPGKRPGGRPSFVCAGSGELDGSTRKDIVALGDTSVAGLRKKAAWVMKQYDARLPGLGATWDDVTWVNLYCVHPPHAYLETEVLKRMGRGGSLGVHWHYARPPIVELEFEADIKGAAHEVWL